MSLVKMRARNHPAQVAGRGPMDEVDDRATVPSQFAEWDRRFGGFTVDVAAAPHNAKCAKFYTREDDGLSLSWGGGIGVVQSAVLGHRSVGREGVGRVPWHKGHRHAPSCESDRAGVVAADDRTAP